MIFAAHKRRGLNVPPDAGRSSLYIPPNGDDGTWQFARTTLGAPSMNSAYVCAWFYVTQVQLTVQSFSPTFFKLGSNFNNGAFLCYADATTGHFFTSSFAQFSGTADTGVSVPLGQWFHLGFGNDTNTFVVDLNGRRIATPTGATGGQDGIFVGSGNQDGQRLDGNFSNVKTWNRILTPGEAALEAQWLAPQALEGLDSWLPVMELAKATIDYTGQWHNWNPALIDYTILRPGMGGPNAAHGFDRRRRVKGSTAGSIGALSGTATATVTASGTLTGTGALSGTAAATTTASGSIVATGALTGSAAATTTASGSLIGTGAISGSAAASVTTSATIGGIGNLSATAAAVASAAGSIIGIGGIAATVTVTITASGSMVATGAMSGTATVTVTATGFLRDGSAVATPPPRFRETGYRRLLEREPQGGADGLFSAEIIDGQQGRPFWGAGRSVRLFTVVVHIAYWRSADRRAANRNAADDMIRVADACENPDNYDQDVSGLRNVRTIGIRRILDDAKRELWELRFEAEWVDGAVTVADETITPSAVINHFSSKVGSVT